MSAAADLKRQACTRFQQAWGSWRHQTPEGLRVVPMGEDWRGSLGTFLRSGLSLDELLDMIPVAMKASGVPTENRWRYFCRCAWSRIRVLEDEAAALD